MKLSNRLRLIQESEISIFESNPCVHLQNSYMHFSCSGVNTWTEQKKFEVQKIKIIKKLKLFLGGQVLMNPFYFNEISGLLEQKCSYLVDLPSILCIMRWSLGESPQLPGAYTTINNQPTSGGFGVIAQTPNGSPTRYIFTTFVGLFLGCAALTAKVPYRPTK